VRASWTNHLAISRGHLSWLRGFGDEDGSTSAKIAPWLDGLIHRFRFSVLRGQGVDEVDEAGPKGTELPRVHPCLASLSIFVYMYMYVYKAKVQAWTSSSPPSPSSSSSSSSLSLPRVWPGKKPPACQACSFRFQRGVLNRSTT
jgi:hypothetical protein